MNKVKLSILTLAAIIVASCATDTVDDRGAISSEATIAKKFVNTSEKALPGEIIICLDEEAAMMLEGAEVATRSGITALDAIAAEVNASDIKPVFNLKVNADAKRDMGMHRWYVMSLPESADLDLVAKRLAAVESIERVQFSTKVERPTAQATEVDLSEIALTRADDMPYDDPMLSLQWHYNNKGLETTHPEAMEGADVNLFPAWEITAGNPDVIVAIVDEGVCYSHKDLQANMLANEAELNGTEGVDDDDNGYIDDVYGYNFARNGAVSWNRSGDTGHGTHVAGTVAAVNNNGIGVAGVAGGTGNGDGVRMISCQIISGDQTAGAGATAAATEYAKDRGACILQCSWGFDPGALANDSQFETGSTSVEKVAFDYFMSYDPEKESPRHPNLDGGIIIFAAGNEGKAVAGYPAAYNEYIAVTAFGPDGLPTYYTCYDRGCNVAAPGGEYAPVTGADYGCVVSTLPGDKYARMQGTSMACPHVSGIAALAVSYAADLGIVLTLPELQDIILSSVNDINYLLTGFKTNPMGGTLNLPTYKNKMGTGAIDAYRVLMAVRGTKCIPIPLGEQVIIDIAKFLGDGNLSIKMVESEISDEVKEKLGITGCKFMGSKLILTCTKAGSALVTLKYVAGGNFVGGGQITGGMEAEQEFAFVVRSGVAVDEGTGSPIVPGGWL